MAERLGVGVAARLSRYLQVLTQAKKMGKERISSQEIAEYTNINATQIRRDLSALRQVRQARRRLQHRLAARRDPQDPAHAGAAQHRARRRRAAGRGDRVLADLRRARHQRSPPIFDTDPAKVGRTLGGVTVSPLDHLDDVVRERNIIVGVLAVPAETAQDACGRARRRRREDRLQLLAGAARHAGRRPGAHLEPRRRAALRLVLPSDLAAGSGPQVPTRLPERRCLAPFGARHR